MKKAIILFFILLFIAKVTLLKAQYDGVFTVGDAFGNSYSFASLNVNSHKPLGSPGTVSAASLFCTAGYFDLYCEPGSLFANSTSAQTVMCEVFTNLSGWISSPLSAPTNTLRVKVFCGEQSPASSAHATGSPFYLVPTYPANPYPGIVENEVYKMIVSGVDGFSHVPNGVIAGAATTNQHFHGYIRAKSTTQWNYSTNTSTLASGYDFYSVMLHEATHFLGFLSLINTNGASILISTGGPGLNHYSTYDLFLKNSAGTSLLASSSTATCPLNNVSFNVATSAITPSVCWNGTGGPTTCSVAAQYSSASVPNMPVYTPNCFTSGSSLSHFEDKCYTPGSFTASPTCTAINNSNLGLYYVMSASSGTGSCYVKRYLKDEEAKVLCDLGYNTLPTFTSNAVAATYSYSGVCNSKDIWGVNDGFNGSVYTNTTTASSIVIPTTAIVANDATTTVQMSCLEIIHNNATYTLSGANLTVTANSGYTGLVIVKYIPLNAQGQYGNPTYIFIYFIPVNCNSTTDCNLVQNGGFENVSYGSPCSNVVGPNNSNVIYNPLYYSIISCWDSYENQPDLYTRNCTNTLYPQYQTGSNAAGHAFETYNGTPNDRFVGLGMKYNAPGQNQQIYTDVLKNNLTSTLVPGQTYKLSFLVSNFSGTLNWSGSVNTNSTAIPLVITVASAPVVNAPSLPSFPSGLHTLAQFTVSPTTNTFAPWTAVTQTFVFNPTVGHSALIIGGDVVATQSLNGYFDQVYLLIDEVSLVPVPSSYFSIPTASACGVTSTYTNLAQYASPTGTFTGAGVTFTNSQYHFNSPATLPTGNYPVAFTSSNGTCTSVHWENIKVSTPYTLTPTGTIITCGSSPNTYSIEGTLSPNLANVLQKWEPGPLMGALQTVSLTNTTIYTLTATDQAGCSQSKTLSVIFYTNCCHSETLNAFADALYTGTTSLTSPVLVVNDFTVQSGTACNLIGYELLFKPNIKLTVANNATLNIYGSHLYACENNMWQGIVVQNGGQIFMSEISGNGADNLIEDAITAIDVSNNTSTLSSILDISFTTFNKNYIDINVSNFQQSSSSYPFTIKRNVFTCRDLPFSHTQWPETGITSSITTSSADLRYATTTTTGLTPPYLGQAGFSITTLLNPYSTQPSHIAIQLHTVGVTTGTNFYGATIGSTTNVEDFNLFDAHGYFVKAIESNVILANNVFQNTRTYSVSSVLTGGNAIDHKVGGSNGFLNMRLDLTASNVNFGNRFWDCHTAVEGNKVYRFNFENGLVRSTHSLSAFSTNVPGRRGIRLITNRFQYYIRDCEFTNIEDAINIPIGISTYTTSESSGMFPFFVGIYAANISIQENSFLTTTVSTNYMNRAIDITNPSQFTWSPAPEYSTTPTALGVVIRDNLITDAFRGINVNGVTGFRMAVDGNTVAIKDDGTTGQAQHGIDLSNNAANAVGQFWVTSNRVLGGTGTGTANTLASLVYCSSNSGVQSPSVTCNTLGNSFQGFVFDMPNPNAIWAGNNMDPMQRGLVLSNGGTMGQQGTNAMAAANVWNSSGSWTGSLTGTYVYTSVAQSSPMWVKTGDTYPPNPSGGFVLPGQMYGGANTISVSVGGDYNCQEGPNARIFVPVEEDFGNEAGYYIAKMSLYRLLYFNPEVMGGDEEYEDFYEAQAATTIERFIEIEDALYAGDYGTARTILDEFDPGGFNTVENNFYLFYYLFADYVEVAIDGGNLPDQYDQDLLDIAELCPGTNGSCVYQARALYNAVYGIMNNYDDCQYRPGARMSGQQGEKSINGVGKQNWDITMYPNPAENNLILSSSTKTEFLRIHITDLSGRLISKSVVKINGFICNLDLSLENGVYLVNIENMSNEKVTKKLLISK